MATVCIKHDSSLRAAALQFSLGHPAVASVLVGTTNPSHIAQNLAALTEPVCHGLWTELLEAGLIAAVPQVPEMRKADADCRHCG